MSQRERSARFYAEKKRKEAAAEEAARPKGDTTPMEAEWRADPNGFIEECLWVRHIDGGRSIPFHLTSNQRAVGLEVKAQMDEGRPARVIVLKSRRALISSYCEALGYWYTSTREQSEGIILAQKVETTEEIFALVDGFYLLDERKVLGLRPLTENSNRRELRFGNPNKKSRDAEPGLQSGLRITSADAKDPGRGGTYHFVHASEVAYWDKDDAWQAVGTALTRAPGTIGIMESTANGQGGLFAETYWGAKAGRGVSDRKGRGANEFTAIFLPWFDDGKNRLALTPEELNRFDYASPAEMRYAERWKLTPEQVMWRRQTIASPQCFKPGVLRENVFQQEYPSHDEEAFLSSGKHFFLLPAVKAVEDDAERGTCEPVLKADIVNDGPSLEERTPRNRFPMKPLLVPNEEGRLFVWKMPNPRHEYLVAVDPAEGLVDGDEAVVYVLDRNDLEYVAAWGGRHLSARELGHIAVLLAVFYGNALLAVEHNNHGLATIEEVRKVCYPYVWHHKDVSRPDSDPTDKVGWVTTQATRSFALLSLEAELRGKALKIHDAEFFSQVRTFMWPSMDGKQRSVTGSGSTAPRARSGCHDDRVLCAAIALAVHMNAPLARLKPEAKPPVDEAAPLAPEPLRVNAKSVMETRRRVRGRSAWR